VLELQSKSTPDAWVPYSERKPVSQRGGTFHRHRHSQVGALTVGYLFDLLRTDGGNFGIGADVTTYAVPENLREPYGSPSSYHVFLHYALGGPSPSAPSH
jgi:hypothetical protein